MKALILKDLMVLRRMSKIYVILIVFYLLFFIIFMNQDTAMFQGLVFILCAMFSVTALSYDERAHWEKYGLTMPVSRKDMVVSKYLLGSGLILFMLLLNLILIVTVGAVKGYPESFEVSLLQTLLLASAGLLFLAINLPIMLKFGVEKGRIVMMILAVLIILSPMVFSQIGGLSRVSSAPSQDPGAVWPLLYLIPVGVLLLTWVSAKISTVIYQRKEFS